MNRLTRWWPYALIIFIVMVYFWKVWLKNLVPFPGDILLGAYLPWLESKWGTSTGIPFKNNPSTPDVYSQFFLWKSLIAESFKSGHWPLWNPYSYSGYPLLANYHSGALYPFNFLMVLLGDANGWSLIVLGGVLGSFVTMYLLLKQFGRSNWAAILGGLAYSFSGFAISWSQFINAPQALIWLPLLVLLIDRYFEKRKITDLLWLPCIFFFFFTAGHFQITVYGSLLLFAFVLWRQSKAFSIRKLFVFLPILALTVGFVSVQLLPTFEMAQNGMRTGDRALESRNYGLSPTRNLVNLVAPDFFGNPVTMNFWGFFNYHETIFYAGILTTLAIIWTVLVWKYLESKTKFFWIVAILAILFGFDTPLGRAIYSQKVPGLSTSDAGRVASMFAFGGSIVLAGIADCLDKISKKKVVLMMFTGSLVGFLVFFIAIKSQALWGSVATGGLTTQTRQTVSIRNVVLPIGLIGLSLFSLFLFKKNKQWVLFFWFVILVLDLFRFGWKYTPFVPKLYLYPDTAPTAFLEEKSSNEVFRIDREKAEILPNATWMAFRLMSPSGYDPMALKEYVSDYDRILNHRPEASPSRYSEIDTYDAEAMGYFNVKYLMVVKRDRDGKIGGELINGAIDQRVWNKVFETRDTAILENTKYQERTRIVDSNGRKAEGKAWITQYTNDRIVVGFSNINGSYLLLADTYYPGWKATINGKQTKIGDYIKPFRVVDIRGVDKGEIIFEYKPKSFSVGLFISCFSLVVWFVIEVYYLFKKNE